MRPGNLGGGRREPCVAYVMQANGQYANGGLVGISGGGDTGNVSIVRSTLTNIMVRAQS